MQDPKCPHCKRTLEGYYEFHRTFFKCICGKEWKGYNMKVKDVDKVIKAVEEVLEMIEDDYDCEGVTIDEFVHALKTSTIHAEQIAIDILERRKE